MTREVAGVEIARRGTASVETFRRGDRALTEEGGSALFFRPEPRRTPTRPGSEFVRKACADAADLDRYAGPQGQEQETCQYQNMPILRAIAAGSGRWDGAFVLLALTGLAEVSHGAHEYHSQPERGIGSQWPAATDFTGNPLAVEGISHIMGEVCSTKRDPPA